MVLGVAFGILAGQMGWGGFVDDYIAPLGTIFINALKLIAVPLVVASLIKGVSDLRDISSLSAMGGRTIGLYLVSTVIAVTIGLVVVNAFAPGRLIGPDTRESLVAKYADQTASRQAAASDQQNQGPLQPLVDVVPENFAAAASDNGKMLQVIFFALFFGVAMILIDPVQSAPVKAFFDGANEVVLKLVDLIMLTAPVAVFALLAALVTGLNEPDVLYALLGYAGCVLLGLGILIFVLYPLTIKILAGVSYRQFFNGMGPAQLLALSTSSSAATLPVTMERVTEHIGVREEVASFVLPIGATINMDGTSLYQAVAAVFIAQAYAMDLSLATQLGIVVTATAASIGSAAVPGAGMVMLVIVLEQAGIPAAGLGLIVAIDRPLDMCRTVANVSGDATVATLIAKMLGKLGVPVRRDWDDHLAEVL